MYLTIVWGPAHDIVDVHWWLHEQIPEGSLRKIPLLAGHLKMILLEDLLPPNISQNNPIDFISESHENLGFCSPCSRNYCKQMGKCQEIICMQHPDLYTCNVAVQPPRHVAPKSGKIDLLTKLLASLDNNISRTHNEWLVWLLGVCVSWGLISRSRTCKSFHIKLLSFGTSFSCKRRDDVKNSQVSGLKSFWSIALFRVFCCYPS